MKSYTDLEQSKKLAEILPIESADMRWEQHFVDKPYVTVKPWTTRGKSIGGHCCCCWSLAALLGVLPKIINHETLFIETSAALWHIGYRNIYTARTDNPIDACYEMILKLHELKML